MCRGWRVDIGTTWRDTTCHVVHMADPGLLILMSLSEEDRHGYAMVEDIAGFAGVRLGPGTLYGAITRLEKLGWIRPIPSSDRRQPYRLTAAGKQHLEGELAALRLVVQTGLARLRPA